MVLKFLTMKKLIAFTISLLLISCSSSERKNNTTGETSVVKTYYVAPYKVHCADVSPTKCLLIKTTPNDVWTNFSSPIKGFVHEAGYTYIIKVTETSTDNMYILKEVVEKKAFTQASTNLYDIWGIIEVKGIDPLKSNCEQTLEINLNQNTIMGKSGCNNFRGEVEVNDATNNISFKKVVTTRLTCTNQALEDQYLTALNSVDAFFHYNQNLLFISKGEVVIKARRMD